MIRSVRSGTAGRSSLGTRSAGLKCPLTKCSVNRSVTPSVAQRILSFGSVRPARLSNRMDYGPCAMAAQNHQARKDLIRHALSSDHLQGSHSRHSLSPTRSITVPHPLEASLSLSLSSRLLRCPGAQHPVEVTILGQGAHVFPRPTWRGDVDTYEPSSASSTTTNPNPSCRFPTHFTGVEQALWQPRRARRRGRCCHSVLPPTECAPYYWLPDLPL